ncbi:hypothetical protein HGG76_02405 [Ochrobactrum tritici]|uniref:DNA-directed RNA polymerase n=1 Tax=Brucella tritici TaxID=94626 RepID=A0A7X6FNL6_9HYPH|nr:hypothetical protein [Brucella tritici]
MGFYVRQFYGEKKGTRIDTNLDGQRIMLQNWHDTNTLDVDGQTRAVAPNFVHSLDASALMSCVNLLGPNGIECFTSIHDAYGSVAADMHTLASCLREAFILTYSEPVLKITASLVSQRLPERRRCRNRWPKARSTSRKSAMRITSLRELYAYTRNSHVLEKECALSNELSTRVDPTQLHMVSRDRVANVAHALLNGANHERAPEILAGVAVLFAVMAERSAVDPEELYHLGRRILFAPAPHHHKPNVQMEALRDFAGLRVRNQSVI